MLVKKDQFDSVLQKLAVVPKLAVDTETTGLSPYKGDNLFSVVVAAEFDKQIVPFYFNFQDYQYAESLPRSYLKLLELLFLDPGKLIYGANFKFDMHFLAKEGVFFKSQIWDVLCMARIQYNNHMTYNLGDVAQRLGHEKSTAVDEHIKEHRLYRMVGGKRNPAFDKVPLDIMQQYAEQDAVITYQIGEKQAAYFEEWDRTDPIKPVREVVEIEKKLTPILFDMEYRGIRVDLKYCEKAITHEKNIYEGAALKFEQETGVKFLDSAKTFKDVFAKYGIAPGLTAKGNASFTDDVLAEIDHPIAELIRTYREAYKKCITYYENFIDMADESGYIHPNYRQTGTVTGRMSCTNPNLQNLSNEAELVSDYKIRKSFVADEDCILVAIDYMAMEMRVLLDYANEAELARRIKSGMDPHQSTADMIGVTRKQAKTLGFGLVYGMGAEKLARSLDVSLSEAKNLKRKYFSGLPRVRDFFSRVKTKAEDRGYIVSKYGMPLFIDKKFSYKAVNAIIQSSCAHAVKKAMIDLDSALKCTKSRMLCQIHDEVLFSVHKDDIAIVPKLMQIMADSYPASLYGLDCSVEYSDKSWGELTEELPLIHSDECRKSQKQSLESASPIS